MVERMICMNVLYVFLLFKNRIKILRIKKDHPTNDSQGEFKVNLHASQEGLPGSSPLRSDDSWDSPEGEAGPAVAKGNSRGGFTD